MTRQPLTYIGSTYFDRLPVGDSPTVDLQVTTTDDLGALFRAICRSTDYDIAEMSLSNYLTLRGNGDTRWTALPVFPSRAFRHSQIYVNERCGIRDARDLRGRRIGIPEYHMTAGVWMRAFLEEDFSVAANEIEWITPAEALAYVAEIDFPVPPDVRLVPTDAGLDDLLASGEIDALFTVTAPPSYVSPHTDVVRLFPNYREVEEEYYRRTALFPIMHTIVMRAELEREAPGVALELVELFQAAKERGIRRLTNLNAVAVVDPWIGDDLEQVAGLFGGDPFVYGVSSNRETLETMLRYHLNQGLSRTALSVEEVFATETLEWIPRSDVMVGRRW